MKNTRLAFLLSVCCILSPVKALAVDNYQGLLFGSSVDDLQKKHFCHFVHRGFVRPNVDFYSCSDFEFGGANVPAGAFFIDGKFLRFAIEPPSHLLKTVLEGLMKKYGYPTSMPSKQEANAVDHSPNREVFFKFDHDTVILKIASDTRMRKSVYLIYTSASYDSILSNMEKQSVDGKL